MGPEPERARVNDRSLEQAVLWLFPAAPATFVALRDVSAFAAIAAGGRGSSTSSVSLFFAAIHAAGAGAKGFVIGLVICLIMRRMNRRIMLSHQSFLTVVLVLLIFSAFVGIITGKRGASNYELQIRPRILKKSTKIKEHNWSTESCPSPINGTEVCNVRAKGSDHGFVDGIRVDCIQETIVLRSKESEKHYQVGYEYVTGAYGVALDSSGAAAGIALLVRLRASSHRSILFIFDSDMNLEYEELVEAAGASSQTINACLQGDGNSRSFIVNFANSSVKYAPEHR